MVQIQKKIVQKKVLYPLLFGLSLYETATNEKISQSVGKSKSLVYNQLKELYQNNFVFYEKQSSGLVFYSLNYEKLASEFLKYLSKFIYNEQIYNLNNRLEKNILLHSLIKQYLKLS
ncbi:MAG TPA: hypothetical protein VKN74_02620, partial [Candidatus Mcinerneyibacterium sp.]|nr:hypothetical protein [Candidatus Mcinerneyibacterium sp.]